MIDKRVIERQIRKGKLDAQAYRRTLEALPDVSDRVARDIPEPARPPEPQAEAPASEPEAASSDASSSDASSSDASSSDASSSDASASY